MGMDTAYNRYRVAMGSLDAEYEMRFDSEVKNMSDIHQLNDWYEENAEYNWCEFMTGIREEAE